jgi:prevent-host-death family protein
MAITIDVELAEDELPILIDRAAAGEEIVLTKAGQPVARITALADRAPGQADPASRWEINAEALPAPTDPEDLDWADGKYRDELGISLPRRS